MAHCRGGSITADEVLTGIDLGGKRALVTGVSSGIGAATAQALVAQSVAAFSLLSLCGLGWLFRGQQAAVATGN